MKKVVCLPMCAVRWHWTATATVSPSFPHCLHLPDATGHCLASQVSLLLLPRFYPFYPLSRTTSGVIKCSHSCVPTSINQLSLCHLSYFQQSVPCPVLSVLCSLSNPSPILPTGVCGVLLMRQSIPGGSEHSGQCRLSLCSLAVRYCNLELELRIK